MSVYTKVEKAELESFLLRYSLGNLIHHSGIEAGVTNTNYFVETSSGNFVLTLFEHLNNSGIDYILGLQKHLANHGVSCAAPVPDNQGLLFSTLNNRPAAIVNRVPGTVHRQPSVQQCAQIGAELARFHLAGQNFEFQRANPRGLEWWLTMSEQLRFVLNESDYSLIMETIEEYQSFNLKDMPRGAIHGDLFHDNVLFNEKALGGIFDFDYACHDYFVYDIAITMNDWCVGKDGALKREEADELLSTYDNIRPLLECERAILPTMFQVAALRFWLSRLYDKTFPLEGELTFVKDPDEFRRMLINRRMESTLFSYAKTGENSAE